MYSMTGLDDAIRALQAALDDVDMAVKKEIDNAVMEGAEIIKQEQVRLLNQKFPHLSGLIKIKKLKRGQEVVAKIGYDTDTLKQYPEL